MVTEHWVNYVCLLQLYKFYCSNGYVVLVHQKVWIIRCSCRWPEWSTVAKDALQLVENWLSASHSFKANECQRQISSFPHGELYSFQHDSKTILAWYVWDCSRSQATSCDLSEEAFQSESVRHQVELFNDALRESRRKSQDERPLTANCSTVESGGSIGLIQVPGTSL